MTAEMQISKGMCRARLNILISGGTGSGKTTLLNVMSSFIPHDDRIVTVEDSAGSSSTNLMWYVSRVVPRT